MLTIIQIFIQLVKRVMLIAFDPLILFATMEDSGFINTSVIPNAKIEVIAIKIIDCLRKRIELFNKYNW